MKGMKMMNNIRFNYRNTLIKEFFDRYSKEDRHELYNLIKVYRLYKNVDRFSLNEERSRDSGQQSTLFSYE